MKFKLGQMVYIITDPEQKEYIIIARREFLGGTKTYTLAHDGMYIDTYEVELSDEKDPLKNL